MFESLVRWRKHSKGGSHYKSDLATTRRCVGPRGDGYSVDTTMTAEDAETYHGEQIACFASAGADLVTGVTINYVEEAVGVARAALARQMPVVISFTVETDGRLPGGQPLGDAVPLTTIVVR